MNAKISVLFYAKKSKTKSNLRVPIYLRITVNGKRAEFSTGKDVEISKWSSAQNRLKGNSEEARAINSHSLTSRHFQFFVKNIPIKEQADKV